MNQKLARRGSGNVYRDLGRPDAEVRLLRAQLFVALQQAIAESGQTQAQTAAQLGTDQARISRLVNGHVEEFNTEALEQYLRAFDIAVEPAFVPVVRSAGAD